MKGLLDTVTLVLATSEPSRLPDRIAALIEDGANEIVVSAASAWEKATRFRIGKLDMVEGLVAH